ncbi:MAG: hypothetical protein RLY14_3012, partial [Planctomycetota bacterium]
GLSQELLVVCGKLRTARTNSFVFASIISMTTARCVSFGGWFRANQEIASLPRCSNDINFTYARLIDSDCSLDNVVTTLDC